MRNAFSCVVLMVSLSVAIRAGAQPLDDAAVREAMRGLNAGNMYDLTMTFEGPDQMTGGVPQLLGRRPNTFIIVTAGPEGRIGVLAADFQASGKTLSLSDVPSWMRDRSTMFMTVYRTAGDPSEASQDTDDPLADVQRIYLRSTQAPSRY